MNYPSDVGRLHTIAPNCTTINMYGSTETQRSVGYFSVTNEILPECKEVIFAGKGMKGCQVLVLNKLGQHAGVGEVGELYMRSHFLAKGYVGLEKETNAKFLQNSFSNIPGDRLYRTGDLGRYTPNGDVECFGRADDQVKIRGFRIEIGEINATLSKHPAVKECVTIVREDKAGEKKLASYIVPAQGQPQDIDLVDVRKYMRSKLPSYMVPTYFVPLPRLPLTPNGKIDRKALPKPQGHLHSAEETTAKSGIEGQVIELWANLLGTPLTLGLSANLSSHKKEIGIVS